MAKISTLPLAGPLDGSETIPLVQDDESRQSNIAAYTNDLMQPYVDQTQGFRNEAAGFAGAAGEYLNQLINAGFSASAIYDIAGLAIRKSGVFFLIHPAFCFQERIATATTPALIGDPVGSFRSADGAWVAIASQDDRRPILMLDEAGHYCLGEGAKNMVVQDLVGGYYDPTTAWTHIGGWRAGGVPSVASGDLFGSTPFSWGVGSGQGRRLYMASKNNTGVQIATETALNTTAKIFDDTQDPITVPFVLRVVKSLTDIAGYYNDGKERQASTVVPWDDSAITRRLGLFMNRVDSPAQSNFDNGRFYGGLWVPGTLTEDETSATVAEMMRLTIPKEPVWQKDPNPVILDFDNDDYTVRGKSISLSDLIDNGGGSYTLEDTRWWGHDRTYIIDVDSDLEAGSHAGVFIEALSGNLVNEQIAVNSQSPQSQSVVIYPSSQGLATQKGGGNFAFDVTRRMRIAFVCKAGEPVHIRSNNSAVSNAAKTFVSLPPTAIKINTAVTGWTLHRAAFYGEALEGDDLWDAMNAGTGPAAHPPLHVLGDSFTAWGGYDFGKRVFDEFYDDGPVLLSNDGVGGVAFYEGSGTGHSQRWEHTPQHYGKTLILNDGGYEYRTWGDAISAFGIMSIVQKLKLDGDNLNRWLITEPNPITNEIGGTQRGEFDLGMTQMRLLANKNAPNARTVFVETLEAMFCIYSDDATVTHYDSGDNIISTYVDGMTKGEYDRACVLAGLWPRTASSDATHYLEPGRAVYAKAAAGMIKDMGWGPGTTALPDTVQNLTATGSVLTWDMPADDGGHPVLGFQVQKNTGSWVTQSAQGSPTVGRLAGNKRQYIREWTAPDAGTYRVAAITYKGQGDYTEVVVT
jgi:hypothetical protein